MLYDCSDICGLRFVRSICLLLFVVCGMFRENCDRVDVVSFDPVRLPLYKNEPVRLAFTYIKE
jgi:hypothetical protein